VLVVVVVVVVVVVEDEEDDDLNFFFGGGADDATADLVARALRRAPFLGGSGDDGLLAALRFMVVVFLRGACACLLEIFLKSNFFIHLHFIQGARSWPQHVETPASHARCLLPTPESSHARLLLTTPVSPHAHHHHHLLHLTS